MNRRDFLERLTKLAGSTAAATAALPLLQSDLRAGRRSSTGQRRPARHRDASPSNSPKGKISGYLARPKSKRQAPRHRW